MMLKHALIGAMLAAAAAAAALPATAQDSQCEARGTNGMVTFVLCPSGLDQEAWKAAGTDACGTRMPCGAWIWDSASNVPPIIPDSHDKLPARAVQTATAIWVNEMQSLVVIEKGSN